MSFEMVLLNIFSNKLNDGIEKRLIKFVDDIRLADMKANQTAGSKFRTINWGYG